MKVWKYGCLCLSVLLMSISVAGAEEPPQAYETETTNAEPVFPDQAGLIKTNQECLRWLGHDPGPSDGVVGPRTTRAIQQYLLESGYDPGPIDGIPGQKTKQAITQFLKAMEDAGEENPCTEVLKILLAWMNGQETLPPNLEVLFFFEEPEPVTRTLTLFDAVNEAIEVNLELLNTHQQLAVAEQDIARAKAQRFPRLTASAMGTIIDEDRASAPAGQAERSISGSLSLTQIIFSDKVNANVTIEKLMQQARTDELEQVKLDITLEAAAAYLNILRAKTYETIQKDNLQVTISNLEQAKLRYSVGISRLSDVYRWEAEVAADKQDFLDAKERRKQAEIHLNRLLHRPQEEQFGTAELSIDDPLLSTGATPLLAYLDNPSMSRLFRDFAVQKGLENAPELAQLDAASKAQQRLKSSISRECILPTIVAQGEVTDTFWKDGKGSEDIPGAPDGLTWHVGLQVSLPLFSGGARIAESRQASLELDRLILERSLVEEQLEHRIRSAFYSTSHSYAKIDLSRDEAEAAHKTLEVMIALYARGAVAMLDLIDAQNAALVADLVVTDSKYNFLIALMKSERAINHFDFFSTPEERERFFQEFDEYRASQQ